MTGAIGRMPSRQRATGRIRGRTAATASAADGRPFIRGWGDGSRGRASAEATSRVSSPSSRAWLTSPRLVHRLGVVAHVPDANPSTMVGQPRSAASRQVTPRWSGSAHRPRPGDRSSAGEPEHANARVGAKAMFKPPAGVVVVAAQHDNHWAPHPAPSRRSPSRVAHPPASARDERDPAAGGRPSRSRAATGWTKELSVGASTWMALPAREIRSTSGVDSAHASRCMSTPR